MDHITIRDHNGTRTIPKYDTQPRPALGDLLPPEPAALGAIEVQPAAQTIIHQKDTELTRAKATVVFSLPLALGLSLVTTAVVLTLTATPILSAVTLIVFFLTFVGAWLAAFIFHVSRSPAGAAYMHTKSMWRVIEREQRHRHAAYWYHTRREEESHHDRR